MKTNPDFVARKVGTEFVLVPVVRQTADLEGVYTLNAVGSLVWSCLADGTEMDGIVDRVVEEYEVDRDTALADVQELVAQLRVAGAVID